MKIKAKRDIAYDFEDYGIDFKQGIVYTTYLDSIGYRVETENGSEVWITDSDIQRDFDIVEE